MTEDIDRRRFIYGWTAKRSGAAITVSGKDLNGTPFRLADVHFIEPKSGGVRAVTRDREIWWLWP